MINNYLKKLFGITFSEQWIDLVRCKQHSIPIQQHRAQILSERTRLFSLLFGIIIPAWSIVDYILLPFELWYKLAVLRMISGAVFLLIAYRCNKKSNQLEKIRICMGVMLLIPTVFFVIANPIVQHYHLTGFSGALINIYSLLPFLVIAALSIFTLTLSELVVLSLPIISITLWNLFPENKAEIPDAVMQIWLFILLILSSFFSSISQMRYMISQVTRASYDGLTNAMTRKAGIEALDVYYRMATLQNTPLSLLFIDIDNFKEINDTYGHQAGDEVLRNVVIKLKNSIRRGDSIIRWGGEEFILLLPYADHKDTLRVLERINLHGIGHNPNGNPLTASMGLGERLIDNIDNWEKLIETADQRMYEAKNTGKSRCVCYKDKTIKLFSTRV